MEFWSPGFGLAQCQLLLPGGSQEEGDFSGLSVLEIESINVHVGTEKSGLPLKEFFFASKSKASL